MSISKYFPAISIVRTSESESLGFGPRLRKNFWSSNQSLPAQKTVMMKAPSP